MAVEHLTFENGLQRHSEDPQDPFYEEVAFSPENIIAIIEKLNELITKVNGG